MNIPIGFDQSRVLDIFQLDGVMCAHTSTEDGTHHRWHAFTIDGHCLGSVGRPEMLGWMIRRARWH
ncbi:hypothetical protein ACWDD9_10450 [Kitasatospora sp. NPDC001119]